MGGAQLVHGLCVLFIVGGLAVPVDGILHVADAQAMSELRAAHASLEKEIEFNNG